MMVGWGSSALGDSWVRGAAYWLLPRSSFLLSFFLLSSLASRLPPFAFLLSF